MGVADVTNSGSISGSIYGVWAPSAALPLSSIPAASSARSTEFSPTPSRSSVFNAVTISGGTAAIQFAGVGNTLTLAPGSAITGTVFGTGSDTFQLDGTGSATFDVSQIGVAAQYRGFGTFDKIGSSAWTLTGTSTYAGPVNVNGGTLSVNGDLSSAVGGVTVNTGATLGGTGTLPTTVIASGGTLAPGNSIGTINVQGNLMLNAGSTYRVEADAATADKTIVSGTASLGGTLIVVPTSRIGTRTTYTIINAAAYTGAFATMAVSSPSLARFISVGVNGNNYDITLDVGTLILTPGTPGNPSNAGNAINNAILNGANPSAGFNTLLGLTGDALTNALMQVSGQGGNGATAQTGFTSSNQFVGAMLDPSIDNRGGDDGSGGASGYADEESDALAYAGKRRATQAERDAYAAVTPRNRRVESLAARWSVWASGYGGSSSVSGNAAAGTNTTTSNIYGTAVGVDYRVGRDTLIGFSMGGAGVNFNTGQGLGGGHADLFQFGVYGRHNIGAAYIAGALAYGWQDVTTDRTVTVAGTDRLRANFHTNTFAARAEAGYRFATALMGVTPYGALQATTFRLPSYAEAAVSGSNQFALAFASQSTTNVRSELGLRGDKSYAVRDGVLTFRGRAAWAHDSNTDRAINPTFQSLPGSSFTINGARPSADGALVTAGAEMKWRNNWSLAGTFEGEFSRTTDSYAGKGTVKYAW